MFKLKQLYAGKAKSLYTTDNPKELIMQFNDKLTAFNAKKSAVVNKKGTLNNQINAIIMQYLMAHGIPTHYIKSIGPQTALVKTLSMIPLECVVRNISAGSILKRLPFSKGFQFKAPIVEFYFKDDTLGDPLVNEDHILAMQWLNTNQISRIKTLTLQCNKILQTLFKKVNLTLVDFKLEFGFSDEQIILGDEVSPDSCRLWDTTTRQPLDKDCFREDIGDISDAYHEVLQRLEAVPSS